MKDEFIVTLDENIVPFEFDTEDAWVLHAESVYDGNGLSIMVNEPTEYPAIGWPVHTIEDDRRGNSQIWAFIYPCK